MTLVNLISELSEHAPGARYTPTFPHVFLEEGRYGQDIITRYMELVEHTMVVVAVTRRLE